jgi:hypothetical protein
LLALKEIGLRLMMCTPPPAPKSGSAEVIRGGFSEAVTLDDLCRRVSRIGSLEIWQAPETVRDFTGIWLQSIPFAEIICRG